LFKPKRVWNEVHFGLTSGVLVAIEAIALV
jgi:hypothetical protein